jgi:hypothetical protein
MGFLEKQIIFGKLLVKTEIEKKRIAGKRSMESFIMG